MFVTPPNKLREINSSRGIIIAGNAKKKKIRQSNWEKNYNRFIVKPCSFPKVFYFFVDVIKLKLLVFCLSVSSKLANAFNIPFAQIP